MHLVSHCHPLRLAIRQAGGEQPSASPVHEVHCHEKPKTVMNVWKDWIESPIGSALSALSALQATTWSDLAQGKE